MSGPEVFPEFRIRNQTVMEEIRIIEVKQSVFADNDEKAEELRQKLHKKGCFLVNIMSSPGSGKTSILTRLIPALKDKYKIAVMEADIDSDVDARTIAEKTGAATIQLHTGGMCHLDAAMTRQGLEEVGAEAFDLIFLENVGNLVCPAEFDTGASKNLVILSVPEGDDKPLKYPLMFEKADVVLLNKIDVLPYFDFDVDKFAGYLKIRNPRAELLPVSARSGEGLEHVVAWLEKAIEAWRKQDA